MTTAPDRPTAFDGVERVVADPIRFKIKLGIGERAFVSLRIAENLKKMLVVGSGAAAGAGVSSSSLVAATFFSKGGLMAALGLGAAAATPVGWIAAAAVAAGGASYGVIRLLDRLKASRVHAVPTFINTPLDLLGAALFDLIAGLAVGLARFDGSYDGSERRAICEYFVSEWGFDPDFVARALAAIEETAGERNIRAAAAALRDYKRANPDCDEASMRAEIVRFLREVAEADGVLDEREELALEKIGSLLAGSADPPAGTAIAGSRSHR